MRVLWGRMSRHEPWWAEFWAAVGAILWCLFAVGLTTGLEDLPAFRVMVSVAPPWAWYVFSALVPAAQIMALRLDRHDARLVFCAVMAWWWSFLTIGLLIAIPPSPGIALYLMPLGINLYSLRYNRTHRQIAAG